MSSPFCKVWMCLICQTMADFRKSGQMPIFLIVKKRRGQVEKGRFAALFLENRPRKNLLFLLFRPLLLFFELEGLFRVKIYKLEQNRADQQFYRCTGYKVWCFYSKKHMRFEGVSVARALKSVSVNTYILHTCSKSEKLRFFHFFHLKVSPCKCHHHAV